MLAPKQGNSQVVAFGNALPNATAFADDERSFPQAAAVAPAPQAVCASIITAGSAPGPELVGLEGFGNVDLATRKYLDRHKANNVFVL